MGNTHYNWTMTGQITGKGWDDNIIHAMATIAQLDELPEVINMVGWSRGAVSCTKMAYQLHKVFPQIRVSIFAADPVAGLGNRGNMDCKTIYPNVKHYCAILAMDENRKSFRPQSLKRLDIKSKGTNVMFLPLPGNHAGVVKLFENLKLGVGAAPTIVWHLAYEFLTKHGTRLKSRLIGKLSDTQMLELYAEMMLKHKAYRKTKHSRLSSDWAVGAASEASCKQPPKRA